MQRMKDDPNYGLLPKIESFIKKYGISDRTFGLEANGDTKLIHTLRKGRELRYETRKYVEKYMENYKPKETA